MSGKTSKFLRRMNARIRSESGTPRRMKSLKRAWRRRSARERGRVRKLEEALQVDPLPKQRQAKRTITQQAAPLRFDRSVS